ncbi:MULTISPECIES: hypothetical protein [Microbacterium]|uniref:Uncharacterized protein n=1 Tax=Microbacterium wangchenii TaxID=2541726 RepID=A0ABX5SQ55_9MICO|nr:MULTISPECIES: hypothetical protein [Microbacterium]MCK6066613.1 TNT antitoxin family protein [Microbacterium sp. EYE_512]QBR87947.1 hypothetical protein E4K62_04100 [Microbacterium wangchenii]TFV83930.1 hypothetical protein E4V99_02285 [Microbacterium sp. dk485]TXK18263.1 hypothetical protein FVP99_06700 [Microbacterium wangchenii]
MAEHEERNGQTADSCAQLARWLTDEGLELLPSKDAHLLLDDGESRVRIDRTGDGWVLSRSLRDAKPLREVSSRRWQDVERYVVMLYLGSARESRGLSRLAPLVELDAEGTAVVREGWNLRSGDEGGVLLTGPDGAQIWFSSDIAAAAFSRYAVYSADELRAQGSIADAPLARRRELRSSTPGRDEAEAT